MASQSTKQRKAWPRFCLGTHYASNQPTFPESIDILNDLSSIYLSSEWPTDPKGRGLAYADALASMRRRVTVIAGHEKGSGKTTFFNAALAEAQKYGPVGAFTIGFEGAKASPSMTKVGPGDVIITTITLARTAEARLEIIEALSGRSAIGPLCVARAMRGGSASLVGPEGFSQLAAAIEFAQSNGLVESILIDGAAGRLTQAGAIPNAQLAYCVRADSSNYRKAASNIEMIASLAALPLDAFDAPQADALKIDGPLTSTLIETIKPETTKLSINTFCDCFLDEASFRRALQRFTISVRRRVPLLCFVIALMNIKRETFLDAAPMASNLSLFDPLKIGAA
jgi:RecA/RadA recombinase